MNTSEHRVSDERSSAPGMANSSTRRRQQQRDLHEHVDHQRRGAAGELGHAQVQDDRFAGDQLGLARARCRYRRIGCAGRGHRRLRRRARGGVASARGAGPAPAAADRAGGRRAGRRSTSGPRRTCPSSGSVAPDPALVGRLSALVARARVGRDRARTARPGARSPASSRSGSRPPSTGPALVDPGRAGRVPLVAVVALSGSRRDPRRAGGDGHRRTSCTPAGRTRRPGRDYYSRARRPPSPRRSGRTTRWVAATCLFLGVALGPAGDRACCWQNALNVGVDRRR